MSAFPSESIIEYSALVLSCKTKGTGQIQYQWFIGNALIVGASQQELTFTNISRQNAGAYKCVVGNGISQQQYSDALTLQVKCKFLIILLTHYQTKTKNRFFIPLFYFLNDRFF